MNTEEDEFKRIEREAKRRAQAAEDDIMLMALESGPLTQGPFDAWCKRFAALVAAAEREACAKLCEGRGMLKGGEVFAARIRARGTT